MRRVRANRELRQAICLVILQATRFRTPVAKAVLAFLPGGLQVPYRRLPRCNQWGIPVSPREVAVPARPDIFGPWDVDSPRSGGLSHGSGTWVPRSSSSGSES